MPIRRTLSDSYPHGSSSTTVATKTPRTVAARVQATTARTPHRGLATGDSDTEPEQVLPVPPQEKNNRHSLPQNRSGETAKALRGLCFHSTIV